MTGPLRDIEAALAEIRAFKGVLTRLETTLQNLREATVQSRLSSLPHCDVPVTDHRREHRMGPVPKIPGDLELQTFITARIDRMTFVEIARDVAQHFPPGRRVGKSAIHDWWKREGRHGRSGSLLPPDHPG